MATRRIDVNVLACALAERAVADRGEKGCRSRLIDPADFTTVAVDYLSSGNYNAAVSLYEGICQLRKSDAVVLNNLGFCLMPVNLSRAIEVLEQSIEMARKPQAITFANLALAHALSGDFIVARELAERCRLLPPAVDVWLWDIRGDGTFKLRCGVQSGEYAQELIWWIEREHLISRSDFE